jgi:hypothetical protein
MGENTHVYIPPSILISTHVYLHRRPFSDQVAALANLAVNDSNELAIVQCGGLLPIVQGITLSAGMCV